MLSKKHGRDDLRQLALGIGLVLADHPHDRAGFLGRTAEDRRLRILAVEIEQARERLEDDEVAVLEHRYPAARIHAQHLRRLGVPAWRTASTRDS